MDKRSTTKASAVAARRLFSPAILCLVLLLVVPFGCQEETSSSFAPDGSPSEEIGRPDAALVDVTGEADLQPGPRDYKVVHVFVVLCDNKNQGIVPVPAALGNGQDPANNLYWGAMYGVQTFFDRSEHWARVKCSGPSTNAILARRMYRMKDERFNVYVLADAYDGARMAKALQDFFSAAAGCAVTRVQVSGESGGWVVEAGAMADMVCFVGHNGLMDTSVDVFPERGGGRGPGCAVVLACKSRQFFTRPLAQAGCRPLITTIGLVAPEAYTLDAIIRAWARGCTDKDIEQEAAKAYAKYQKIPFSSALRLFATAAQRR